MEADLAIVETVPRFHQNRVEFNLQGQKLPEQLVQKCQLKVKQPIQRIKIFQAVFFIWELVVINVLNQMIDQSESSNSMNVSIISNLGFSE